MFQWRPRKRGRRLTRSRLASEPHRRHIDRGVGRARKRHTRRSQRISLHPWRRMGVERRAWQRHMRRGQPISLHRRHIERGAGRARQRHTRRSQRMSLHHSGVVRMTMGRSAHWAVDIPVEWSRGKSPLCKWVRIETGGLRAFLYVVILLDPGLSESL